MTTYIDQQEIQHDNIEGFDIEHMNTVLAEKDSVTKFINVGGVSAAGKTTLSLILKQCIPEAQTFSIDSYLIAGLGRMAGKFSDIPPDPNRPYIGGITPEVWDMDLVEEHVQMLKQGLSIDIPIFDETIKDRVGYQPYVPGTHIIFEGGHSFSSQFIGYADYKVLVTAPLHDRLTRKIVRTHARFKRDDIDDIIGRYITKDEPSWLHYRDEFTEAADQVFDNPANPQKDYALVPTARYARAQGAEHLLVPRAETGTLTDGEQFGFVSVGSGDYQLFYEVAGRQLINLALEKEYIDLLAEHYEVTRA